MAIVKVSIGRKKFSLERILSNVPETSGACVVFIGVVRGRDDGKKVDKLEYTAYDKMARKELKEICNAVAKEQKVDAIYIHHRIGTLKPGEPTLYIVVFAPHRSEGFAACRDVLELVKQKVPIWKKEFVEGKSKWK
ncbi:MAG: molybdenum cofactor biosynthesis protein MoaE [Thermoplasmata archaeon]